MTETKKGSLVVVGTGINVAAQMTLGAKAHIEAADIVFAAVSGTPAEHWLKKLNTNVIFLGSFYDEGKSRVHTYREMSDAIIKAVHEGKNVCAAFYGHPGVFVTPTHLAIKTLKEQGYDAWMDPGISAEDCLVADLGIDPARTGCQSLEASQLLFYKHVINPNCLLVIWQIGIAGEDTLRTIKANKYNNGLKILTEMLLEYYPEDHEVIIYEAAALAVFPPRIERMPLCDLPNSKPTTVSTLVIPSKGLPEFDTETLAKMGLTVDDIKKGLNP